LGFGFATPPSFLLPSFRSVSTTASLSSALTTSTICTSSSCDSRSLSRGSAGGDPILSLLMLSWTGIGLSSLCRNLIWSLLGVGMRGGDGVFQ